jgi:hypothetical protein
MHHHHHTVSAGVRQAEASMLLEEYAALRPAGQFTGNSSRSELPLLDQRDPTRLGCCKFDHAAANVLDIRGHSAPQCIVNSAHNASRMRPVRAQCGVWRAGGVEGLPAVAHASLRRAERDRTNGAVHRRFPLSRGQALAGNQQTIVWLWVRLPMAVASVGDQRRVSGARSPNTKPRVRCGPAFRAVARAGVAPRRALDDAHGVLLAAFPVQPDRSSRPERSSVLAILTNIVGNYVPCGDQMPLFRYPEARSY